MRVKRGKTKSRKHKAVLKQAKGYRLTYSKLYRRAKEALLHAGDYSFSDRKKRGSDFRKLWIKRINAAVKPYDMKYSTFISALKSKNIEIDRKNLATIALEYPEAFKAIVEKSK